MASGEPFVVCPQGHQRKRLTASLRAGVIAQNKAKDGKDGASGDKGTLHGGRFRRGAKHAKQSQFPAWRLCETKPICPERTAGERRQAGGSRTDDFAKQSQLGWQGSTPSPLQERGCVQFRNDPKQSQFGPAGRMGGTAHSTRWRRSCRAKQSQFAERVGGGGQEGATRAIVKTKPICGGGPGNAGLSHLNSSWPWARKR